MLGKVIYFKCLNIKFLNARFDPGSGSLIFFYPDPTDGFNCFLCFKGILILNNIILRDGFFKNLFFKFCR